MKKKTKTLLAIGFAVALAGCDQVANHVAELAIQQGENVKIVLAPGFKIRAENQVLVVQGFDACPSADPVAVKLFGPDPLAGSQSCVVIDKERAAVNVRLATSSGYVEEQWQVKRAAGTLENGRPYSRIVLQRPDGSPVVPAN